VNFLPLKLNFPSQSPEKKYYNLLFFNNFNAFELAFLFGIFFALLFGE